MRNQTLLLLFVTFFSISTLKSQSLLDLVEEDSVQTNYATSAFKSTRIIMTHSVANLHKGALDFRILHRFGRVLNGWENFYGLDQAVARFSFDYGITEDLMVGIGRSPGRQEVDGFIKYRFLRQQTGLKNIPLTISYIAGALIATQKNLLPEVFDDITHKTSFYHQLAIGRKFSDKLTLQITPTFLHENLVEERDDYNDKFALGLGGRLKISNRVALMADYHYLLTPFDFENNFNPLSIGVDIETGGHVFQLHFSNSLGLNERAYLTNTTGDWTKGDFMFGFNLSRTFQVYKPKAKNI